MDLVSVTQSFQFPSQQRKPNIISPLRTSFFPQKLSSFRIRSNRAYIQTISSANKRVFLPVLCSNFDESENSENDDRAVETVLKLYTAIKQKNLDEISDIIGEECRCISNFVSTFRPFQGKKQVLDFLSSLIKCLGNNIEFVVEASLRDGMNVGISWKLECKKTHKPLGKGFSFYTCHVYHGKVMIRNVEMFMEPLLHIEPLRLKMTSILMNAKDKMSFKGCPGHLLCAALCIAVFMFFCTL